MTMENEMLIGKGVNQECICKMKSRDLRDDQIDLRET